MSYAQQIANQGSQLSDIQSQIAGRGSQKIADYDRDFQAYTGDMIAHRNGLSQLKTGNEMPRLTEEYFGIKPFTKKLVPALAQKTGLTKFLQDKFKGTKVEALQNNLKEGLAAAKEGRYGDLADAITGGKGAIGGVENFAANALTKAKSILKDGSLPQEDARNAMNGWIKRSVGGKIQEVRQIGGAKFQSLSPEDRANVAKGSVDEDGVPFRPEELDRDAVYKGLTTGRFRLGKDGGLSDTASGANFEATTGNRLLGGGRLKIGEGGQMSFTSEGGGAFDAERSFGGGGDLGDVQTPYAASLKINDTSRSFAADPSYQRGLDRLSNEQDRLTGSVDFGRSTGRPVDPAQLRPRRSAPEETPAREEAGPAEEPTPEPLGQFRTRPGQRVRIRQERRQDAAGPAEPEAAEEPAAEAEAETPAQRAAGKRPAERPADADEGERPAFNEGAGGAGAEDEPVSDFVSRLSLKQPDELSGGGRSFSRDTPLSERPSGPYGSGRDAGTDRFAPPERQPAAEESRAFEPGSFASKNEEGLSPLNRGFESRAAPEAAPVSRMRGQYSKPADSGRSGSSVDESQQLTAAPARAPAAAEKDEAFSGAKTFAKDVGKTEAEAAPVEEAEATLPGVGEVLMGLTAIGGVIKGAIQEHREKKEMDSEQITKPVNPQQASGPVSGVNFDSAPVIDSDDYHHL